MRTLLVTGLVLSSAAVAAADAPCLPKAHKGETRQLGLVEGAPVLCTVVAGEAQSGSRVSACWDVDLKTGSLATRAPAQLPGHGMSVALDAKGCYDGYCLGKPEEGEIIVSPSTDGRHLVIHANLTARVFDVKTKKLVNSFGFRPEKGKDDDAVSNAVVDVLYVGDTIYAVGSDAGPYIGVWAFKDDGTPRGLIKEGGDSFSVYTGTWSVIDDGRVAFSDEGMRRLLILSSKDGKRKLLKRRVKVAPCKEGDISAYLGESTDVPAACKKHIEKVFAPYLGATIAAMPGGDLLFALADKSGSELAVLDSKSLAEKKRIKLKQCAK